MKKKHLALGLVVAAAFFAASTVQAQTCYHTGCAAHGTHWNIPGVNNNANVVKLGWVDIFGSRVVAACVDGTAQLVTDNGGSAIFLDAINWGTAGLRSNASICLQGGNDDLQILHWGNVYNCGGAQIRGNFTSPTYSIKVSGQAGNDTIRTNDDTAIVCGGDGNDYLGSVSGNDWILGGRGDDHMWSNYGDDLYYGEWDSDTMQDHNGSNTVYMGDQADCISGVGYADCGAGADRFQDWSGTKVSCGSQIQFCADL